MPTHPEIATTRPAAERLALAALVASIGFSLVGTLLLQWVPGVAALVGAWYDTLVKGPTWTYMLIAPTLTALMYAQRVGWPRTLRFLAAAVLIGGAAELLGTTTGFPFGAYTYTSWLGPKLLGHVPLFIPFSWFALALIAYDLAGRIAHRAGYRILATAILLTLWDVALDPAMSRAFPFWIYPDGGAFFGMPLSNWAGWLIVSAAIALAFEVFCGGPVSHHPWALPVYVIHCAFPIMLSLLYGLPLAAVIGAGTTVLAVSWVRHHEKQSSRRHAS